jgi:hypothetical protein
MAKLVLLRLADRADESGICYPSQRRLAAECGITERTVRNAITDLICRGLVIIHTPSTPRGDTTRYLLTFATPEPRSGGEPHSGEEQTAPRGGTTFQTEGNHVPVTPEPRSAKPSVNPQRTPREPSVDENQSRPECPQETPKAASATNTPPAKKDPATVARTLRNKLPKDRFEEFLRVYPKRANQPQKVRKAWLSYASQPYNAEDVIADVTFRKTTDDWIKEGGKYVPAPDKYLKHLLWTKPAALIARLTHEIDLHPGNHDSIHHNPQASPEVIADLKEKRIRLNKLRESE